MAKPHSRYTFTPGPLCTLLLTARNVLFPDASEACLYPCLSNWWPEWQVMVQLVKAEDKVIEAIQLCQAAVPQGIRPTVKHSTANSCDIMNSQGKV